MVWAQIDINKPHLVYIILGGFTSLFMLCSSVIKERLYIGEATVATICGIIFGPHGAGLIDPLTWGNTDQITLEFSRIVLVVQCFAVGVELPRSYMERHWRSVTFLLIPVMTFGWLITSLFIWGLFKPSLNWLDSLCVAACVTATDPVLASSVVGKGKFAKRVPKHLRDLLSAESGCNDGMAFPFVYLALYLIKYRPDANAVTLHWICYTILYECVFGAVYGVAVGYIARRAIRYAHEKEWVDRESFLVFYFVLALFCAGSGSILGIDDLLVGFACGVGFSNDGWFLEKTEESHVSNVIDLLINLAFFVYFGTIIPWGQYNSGMLNLNVWRLVVIALLVLFFRRIPIMLALKPVIPDIKTWREALFAGHFGPIGVGAIFVAILARGELETDYETSTPLAVLPEPGFPHLNIIEVIWPITTFLVICSIIVHGSSIAVFTLGKHINTLTISMSYTQANEQGPSWMERLPRIASRSRTSMSLQRSDSEFDEKKEVPPGMLPPIGQPGTFLRRQREEDNPSRNPSRASSRDRVKQRSRRSRKWDSGAGPGGPISQSAIAPAPRQDTQESEEPPSRSDSDTIAAKGESQPNSEEHGLAAQKSDAGPESEGDKNVDPESGEIFEEGDNTVYEDEEGSVLAVEDSHEVPADGREAFEKQEGARLMHEKSADRNHGDAPAEEHVPQPDTAHDAEHGLEKLESQTKQLLERPGKRWREGMNKVGTMAGFHKRGEESQPKPKPKPEHKHGPARAYQYGNTIIVEDEDGEVIKKYDIPAPDKKPQQQQPDAPVDPERSNRRLGQMGRMLGLSAKDADGHANTQADSSSSATTARPPAPARPTVQTRMSSMRPGAMKRPETALAAQEADDEGLRFTINTGGKRMNRLEFIDQIRQMDPRSRAQVVEESDAPEAVKREARKDAREQGASTGSRSGGGKGEGSVPVVGQHSAAADDAGGARGRGGAALQPVRSHESGELKLVDSNEERIPFHDVSSELRRFQRESETGGETAAERRRRQALRLPASQEEDEEEDEGAVGEADEEDSEDDGTERVPPTTTTTAATTVSTSQGGPIPGKHRPSSTPGETAAERRRREGALGLRETEESDSEEDEAPRVVSASSAAAAAAQQQQQRPAGIRFADEGAASAGNPGREGGRGAGRQSTLRWGRDVGR
ncbi:Na+/H+ antiporter [Friedmanniomyces endolithicus]|nr:Na+/H+ antiporter [Friedmanniomyces endolithicus]